MANGSRALSLGPLFFEHGTNMVKRWTDAEKQQLRRLYLKARIPIAQIAVQLDRSTASINTVLTQFGIPRRRSLPKLRLPTRMTPAMARIHAHVCGDGHLVRKREKDAYGYLKQYRQGYYRIRYGIGYTNTNPRLIDAFCRDIRNVFGLRSHYQPSRWMVTVRSKAVWVLLQGLGAGKSRDWRIGAPIHRGTRSVQAAWLHAFFDDEAHFDPQGRIRVRSVNRPGLIQARKMLAHFVPCHLTPARGLYPDDSCYLVVLAAARPRFLRLIGSTKFR